MLYRYEMKKLQEMTKLFLIFLGVLVLVIVMQSVNLKTRTLEMTNAETHYYEYINRLSGEITPEKEQYIVDENERINSAYENIDIAKEKYNKGEIDKEEYAKYNQEYNYAVLRVESIAMLNNTYERIKANGGWFVNDYYWSTCFSVGIFGVIVAIFLSTIFSIYIGNEYLSGMWIYLNSSKNGKSKTVRVKCILSAAITFIMTVALMGSRYIVIRMKSNLPMTKAPLCSMEMYQYADVGISIGKFAIISLLLEGIAAVGFVLIVIFATYVSRNSITGMSAGVVIYLLPMLIKEYAPKLFAYSPAGSIGFSEGYSCLTNQSELKIMLIIPVIYVIIGILLIILNEKGRYRIIHR